MTSSAFDKATEFFNKAFEELGLEEGEYANQDRGREKRSQRPYLEIHYDDDPYNQLMFGKLIVNDVTYKVSVTRNLASNEITTTAFHPRTHAQTLITFNATYFYQDERFFYDTVIPALKNLITDGEQNATTSQS